MQRGDTRFKVILAQFVSRRGFFQKMESPAYQVLVPFGTVLYFQLDQTSIVGHPAGKTGRVKTKECQQGMGLGSLTFRMLA